jgi:hypothetical protein
MWWLVPIAVAGVAGAIYAYFDGEARDARTRWEKQRDRVAQTVEEHRLNIERNLSLAHASYDFKMLTDLHFSSVRVADSAYGLLRDASASLDVMGRMLKDAKSKRDDLRLQLQAAKTGEHRRRLVEEIKMLNELRTRVFPDKDSVKGQRDSLLAEVQRLNAQTRLLKEAVRDRCGPRGRDWYARLEARTQARRAMR